MHWWMRSLCRSWLHIHRLHSVILSFYSLGLLLFLRDLWNTPLFLLSEWRSGLALVCVASLVCAHSWVSTCWQFKPVSGSVFQLCLSKINQSQCKIPLLLSHFFQPSQKNQRARQSILAVMLLWWLFCLNKEHMVSSVSPVSVYVFAISRNSIILVE